MRATTLATAMAAALAVGGTSTAWAQTAARKPAAAKSSATAAATAKPASVETKADTKPYRIAQRPSWVVDPAAMEAPASVSAIKGSTQRVLLMDVQSNHTLAKPQYYLRVRVAATDAAALASVSQPQVQYNPAYQSVTIHEAAVWRAGRKTDRLDSARIEVMRREANLDRLMIDGTQTLMAVLPDVQLGDVVEVAYTVEGDNPIFDGRIGHVLDLATPDPVDHMHLKLIAPRDRTLHTKQLATAVEPERFDEGGHQVIRIVRRNVPAMVLESGTPPWFKVYPSVQVSEYRDWADVEAWAHKLFAPSRTAGPLVQDKIAALKASGLEGEALVGEVLRFVQDEIRYFSASLGVSSHRPKPAEQTLAERLGDCKDKTILLVTMLEALGFDAKPALVSMYRNRGVANYWPGHEQFDHVIARVVVSGTPYWLDATINGQGFGLAGRGHYPYGMALVVGANQGNLEPVTHAAAPARVDYAQRWDFTRLDAPATMRATMTVTGSAAERWRASVAQATPQQVADALAGAHTRARPGLKIVGEPRIDDDRAANVLKLEVAFDYAAEAAYSHGGLDLDFTAFEMSDLFTSPSESTRRTPWLLDAPRQVTSTIEVIAPQAFSGTPPAPVDVQDRHFSLAVKTQSAGSRFSYTRRFERRNDEVLPANLQAYRESAQRARGVMSHSLRLLLVDPKALSAEFARIGRKLESEGFRDDDELGKAVMRYHLRQAIDTHLLARVDAASPMAQRALASLTRSSLVVGEPADALAYADRALALKADDEDTQEDRALALVGLGRLDEAYDKLQALARSDRRVSAIAAMADVDLHLGRHAQAEVLLRELIDRSEGTQRSRALLKLYLAAEAQSAGRGKTALAAHMDQADTAQLHGALLHYLDGRIDRDALLALSREDKAMARLNLAEAYYYIGTLFAVRGKDRDALDWYERAARTKAVPAREVALARLALARAGRMTLAQSGAVQAN